MKKIFTFLLFLVYISGFGQNCSAYYTHISTGLSTSFSDSSYSNFSNYSSYWDFGDSSSSNLLNPNHLFSQSGRYFVCLTIQDTTSCSDTYCDSITVTAPCQASFSYFIDTNYTVYFNNLSTTPPNASFTWNFGDSSASDTSANPQHFYANFDTYIVRLTIIGNDSTCSFTDTLFVNNCNAQFTAQVDSIGIASFSNNSTASKSTAYSWDFGDSTTSNLKNPVHNYTSSGDYVVFLSIYDSLSYCSSFTFDSVFITLPTPCQAGFTSTVSQDSLFLANNASNYTNIAYTFGDSSSSNSENPIHIYSQSGSYQVCQTIFDSASNCSDSFCDSVSIIIPLNCQAGFNSMQSGDSVLFTNTAIAYNRLVYYFGDGDSSYLENPVHLYSQSGNYIVHQTIFNDTTNCRSSFSDTLSVSVSQSCVASYKIAIDTNKRNKLYLVNTSTNDLSHSYFWDFGDGSNGQGRTPTHNYTNFGAYKICLTVSDSILQCSSTYCDSVGLDSNGNVLKGNGYTLQVIDGVFIGIAELSELEKIEIYPNPSTEYINIISTVNQLNYTLFGTNGKIYTQGILINSRSKIEINNIPKGLYFLKLSSGKNAIVKKLIKQ